MGRTSRTASVALALLALTVPMACGDDDDTASTGTTLIVTTTNDVLPGPSSSTVVAEPTSTAAPVGAVVDVTFTGGKVDGGGRKQVEKGSVITLRVTSDVADEVHVHGYDLSFDLEPNVPGEITFTPDAGGVFEVELEHRGVQLVELEVK